MEEVLSKLKGVLRVISKNIYSYSVNLLETSPVKTVNIVINNDDNFAKMFEILYNKHFVSENEMDELTKEKIDMTTIYLFRELMVYFYRNLYESKIEIVLIIDFLFKHSTYHIVKYQEKLDSTKANEDYIIGLL